MTIKSLFLAASTFFFLSASSHALGIKIVYRIGPNLTLEETSADKTLPVDSRHFQKWYQILVNHPESHEKYIAALEYLALDKGWMKPLSARRHYRVSEAVDVPPPPATSGMALQGTSPAYAAYADWVSQTATQAATPRHARFLALATLVGLGAPVNDRLSLRILEQQSASGDPEAPFILGQLYHEKQKDLAASLEKNDVVSAQWHLKSAMRGHVPAQLMMARYYKKGTGVKKSIRESYAWTRQAALSGDKKAKSAYNQLKRKHYVKKRLKKILQAYYENWPLKSQIGTPSP